MLQNPKSRLTASNTSCYCPADIARDNELPIAVKFICMEWQQMEAMLGHPAGRVFMSAICNICTYIMDQAAGATASDDEADPAGAVAPVCG